MKKIFYVVFFVLLAAVAAATTSNYTSFVDGNVLNASDLNNLQTHYTNADNAILDGDTFTGDMNWYSGADAFFYSDAGSTQEAAIYGNNGDIDAQTLDLYSGSTAGDLGVSLNGSTGKIIGALESHGLTSNCSISNSGTTLSISGNTSALSTANPCYVAVESSTAGQTQIAKFTSNVTLTHGAASDTDGNLWGIADANWASTMPMFLGVVSSGTTSYFTFSRIPISATGTAGEICQKTETDCDSQNDVMILTTGLTLASWVNLPITQVGWVNASYATSGGAWTFAAGIGNGFNTNYESKLFTFPQAQHGAASGSYLRANGGTQPAFSTQSYFFKIGRDGLITIQAYLDGDGGTDGSGAVAALMTIPYLYAGNTYNVRWGNGLLSTASATYIASFRPASGLNYGDFYVTTSTTAITQVPYSNFGNGSRTIAFEMSYFSF